MQDPNDQPVVSGVRGPANENLAVPVGVSLSRPVVGHRESPARCLCTRRREAFRVLTEFRIQKKSLCRCRIYLQQRERAVEKSNKTRILAMAPPLLLKGENLLFAGDRYEEVSRSGNT